MASPSPSVNFSGDDASLVPAEPGSQGGSAAGNLQGGDTVLSAPANAGGGAPSGEDSEYGFQRPEFMKEQLSGTVQIYERHVFLCYKSPEVWPPNVEGPDSDRLPRLLASEIKAKKASMSKKTRLTICEGEDGTEIVNGDALIFPDMIKYRRLTHFDVENFVEEVLVKDTEWPLGSAEPLTGSYVFVCAHGSRDKRCGVCGPILVERFKEEIESHGLQGQVFVSPCSHIGGHKYAGNIIIYSRDSKGEVTGHWYGYVAPDDVPVLLEQHIGKGKIVDHLWRGQMGLSEEDQKAAQSLRLQLNVGSAPKESTETTNFDGCVNGTAPGAGGCCQGTGNATCCQAMPKENKENQQALEHGSSDIVQKSDTKGYSKAGINKEINMHKIRPTPTWFESWERADTYAALAVVAAMASVAVAYTCYRQLR